MVKEISRTKNRPNSPQPVKNDRFAQVKKMTYAHDSEFSACRTEKQQKTTTTGTIIFCYIKERLLGSCGEKSANKENLKSREEEEK